MMRTIIDETYLLQFALAQRFPSDLNALCNRDYHLTPFHLNLSCIDLDSYEKSIGGNPDHTADSAIGIADKVGNRVSNSRLLLLELRLWYDNVDNQKISDLIRKYSHSRDILISFAATLDSRFILVYSCRSIAERNKYFLSRFKYSHPIVNQFESWFVEKLEEELVIDSGEYTYETDIEQLKLSLNTNDFSSFVDAIEYWKFSAETYYNRYNLAESEYILRSLIDSLKERNCEGEEVILCDILIEEVLELQNRIQTLRKNNN